MPFRFGGTGAADAAAGAEPLGAAVQGKAGCGAGAAASAGGCSGHRAGAGSDEHAAAKHAKAVRARTSATVHHRLRLVEERIGMVDDEDSRC